MKKQLLFSLFLSISLLPLFGQTVIQGGFVRSVGRPNHPKGTRLAGAVIAVDGAHNSVRSQGNGAFSIPFTGVKAGLNAFRIKSVKLGGYSLFEPALIGRQCPISPNYPLEIILVSEKERNAIRSNFKSQVKARYEAELQRVKAEKIKLGARYQAELDRVNEKYKNCDAYVADMTERYSHIDYATLNYNQACFYAAMERGDMTEAEAILSNYDEGKLQQARTSITANMEKERQALQGINAQLAQLYAGKYEIYAARFENDSAAAVLEQLVALDTTNVDNWRKAADFHAIYRSDYNKAAPYYRHALWNAVKQYGDSGQQTISAMLDYASCLSSQRKDEECLQLREKALSASLSAVGEHSILAARCYSNLALCYSDSSDSLKELECLQKAFALYCELEGETSSSLSTICNNLGFYYWQHKDYAQAERFYQQGIDVLVKGYGTSTPASCSTLYDNMGQLRMMQGRTKDALQYFQLYLSCVKNDNRHIVREEAGAYHKLAWAYRALGEYAKGDSCENINRDLRLRQYGEYGIPLYAYYQDEANYRFNRGEYQLALPLYEKMLHIEHTTYGEKADTLRPIHNIAVCLFKQGKYNEARTWYERKLKALQQNPQTHPQDILSVLNVICSCYIMDGQYAKALEADQRAEAYFNAHVESSLFDYYHRYLILSKLARSAEEWDKTRKDFMADKLFLLQFSGETQSTFRLLRYSSWDIKDSVRPLADAVKECQLKAERPTALLWWGNKVYPLPFKIRDDGDELIGDLDMEGLKDENVHILLLKVGSKEVKAAKQWVKIYSRTY